MAKITLPKEMLGKEAFRILPAREKEEYVSNLLRKILEINADGITISQIKDSTELTYSTIWHHLDVLCCTAQISKLSRGNLDIFYPAGSLSGNHDIINGNTIYTIRSL